MNKSAQIPLPADNLQSPVPSPTVQPPPGDANRKRRIRFAVLDALTDVGAMVANKVKYAHVNQPEPTEEEYLRRQDHVRKMLGAVIGAGYGTVAGGMLGGEVLKEGPNFDRQQALKGMLLGMLTGGTVGYGAGAVANSIKAYTGTHHTDVAPVIQIVAPPSTQVVNQVRDAIKSGSAVANTLAIFTGLKTAAIRPFTLPKTNPLSPRNTPLAPAAGIQNYLGIGGTQKKMKMPKPTLAGGVKSPLSPMTMTRGPKRM